MHVNHFGPDCSIFLFIANPHFWPKIQTESSSSMGFWEEWKKGGGKGK